MRLRAIAVIVVFVAALLGIILLLLLTEMPHLFGAWGQLVTEMQAVQRALHRGLADAVRAVEQQGWVAAWSLIVLETSENGSRAKPEATPSKQHKKKPAPGQGAGKALIQRKYYTQLVLCLQVSRDLQCHNLGNEL